MRHNSGLYTYTSCIFISIITLVLFSCEGPVGPAGEKGLPGEPGLEGVAGRNGSTILSGSGSPSQQAGDMGDFYFDSESRTLYGPKSEEGWTGSVKLKGDPGLDGSDGRDGKDGRDGTDGADGCQSYSRVVHPVDVLCNVVDYYLNLLTFVLFGAKTADGWGTPVVLKGPQGEQGEPGQDGNANVIV